MKRTKCRLELKYRKARSCVDQQTGYNNYKKPRVLFRTKEHLYWFALIESNSLYPKRVWRDREVLMRKSIDAATPSSADVQQAASFVQFLETKFVRFGRQRKMHRLSSLTDATLLNFHETAPAQVINLITASPNNSCVLDDDPSPTLIVKECA